LGAPYWNPYARGTLVGLTRGTTTAHLVRATLEAIAYQTRDVVEAMKAETQPPNHLTTQPPLKADGGAVKNNFLCQFQSDVLGVPVVRSAVDETTALGAAFAAGLAVGFWKNLDEIRSLWKADRTFEPQMSASQREELYVGWKRAVKCALAWTENR
jgi:glycerol kinase